MDIAQTPASDPRAASGASVAQSKLDADYQSFLTLLIAQVSNQNPLEPMDSSVFVSHAVDPGRTVDRYKPQS